jgi:hypothetical protein
MPQAAKEETMKSRVTFMSMAVATAAALAFAGAVTIGPRQAQATPAAAAATKLGCPACHVMPPSKDKLTPRGDTFKSTGK